MKNNKVLRAATVIDNAQARRARIALLSLLLVGGIVGQALAQSAGDFRSRATGNWSTSTTWEQFNGSAWKAEYFPYGEDGFPSLAGTATSAQTSDATSHSVSLPNGIQAGDLLILLWMDKNANSTLGGTALSSWTNFYDDNTGNHRRTAYYKVATGSEGTSMTVTTTANEKTAHNVYRILAGTWQGVPEAAQTTSVSNSTTPDPPSLDPSGWGTEPTLWIVAAHVQGDGGVTVSAPTN